jgi:hypothetical protein
MRRLNVSNIQYNGVSINSAILPEFEVGMKHEIKLELYNEYNTTVQYEVQSMNPEINVIKYPSILESNTKGDLIISFSPDVKLRSAFISSLRIKEMFR